MGDRRVNVNINIGRGEEVGNISIGRGEFLVKKEWRSVEQLILANLALIHERMRDRSE